MANATKTMATINAYGNGTSTTSLRNDNNGYFFFVVKGGQYVARFDFDSEYNSIGAATMNDIHNGYVNCTREHALRMVRTNRL